jgi:hypothetical protein
MTNSSPWLSHGPNRNRWFTELENGDMLNNQMVFMMIFGIETKMMSFWWLNHMPNLQHRFKKRFWTLFMKAEQIGW